MLAQAGVSLAVLAQGAGGGGGGGYPSDPPGKGTNGQGYVAPGQSDFERAEGLIKIGSYDDAIPLLLSIIRDNPNEADSLYYLGYANEKTLNLKTAFVFYAQAIKADPDHKRAHAGLGLLYLKVGDLAHATAELGELKRICAVLCDERQLLATRIGEFKDQYPNGVVQPAPGGKGKAKVAAKPKTPADEDLSTLP